MQDIKLDFKDFLKKANEVLKEREKAYCNYSNHVSTYTQIYPQISSDLSSKIKIRNQREYDISEHAAHCIALKFARIIAAPEYIDSYIDILGYLLLYLRNTSAKYITLTPLSIVESEHGANMLIDFINKHDLFIELH